MSPTDDRVGELLRAFEVRDLVALAAAPGLPEDVPVGAILERWGADRDAYVRHFLGDPPREAFWSPASVAGFDTVKVWFRAGTVVKIEGEWPDMDPVAPAGLGDPDDPLPDQEEELWAARGIALARGETGGKITSLAIFTPTTSTAFRETLAAFVDYREWE